MKIGIALGGGGAKGLAHIGILKAFTEAGIRFDIVTGTSIGALVGAMYAADALAQLEEWSGQIKLGDVPGLLSPTWSSSGLFTGKNAFDRIVDMLNAQNIEDLPIPFAAVSTDLQAAEKVTHRRGNLRSAIRASSAIPAVFTPVQLDGRTLVDGGAMDPVPVQTARELGADFVVGVDLFGNWPHNAEQQEELDDLDKRLWPMGVSTAQKYLASLSGGGREDAEEKEERPDNMIKLIEDTLSVITRQLTENRLEKWPADLLVQPPVSHVGILDFHRGASIVDIGYHQARSFVERIPRSG
jgi:NTE family protein